MNGNNENLQTLEKELIEAAQAGSLGAFEQLIVGLERKMLGLAAGMASSPDEAEDIYQDAMICAYRALPKFRMDSQFSTWLYRILVNTAISYQRKLKTKLAQMMTSEHALGDGHSFEQYGTSEEENPERELVNEQLSRAINEALASLSDKERIAFVLCHQQEFKISEAAEVMQCSEGTVKSYLFRSREKLREQLQSFRR